MKHGAASPNVKRKMLIHSKQLIAIAGLCLTLLVIFRNEQHIAKHRPNPGAGFSFSSTCYPLRESHLQSESNAPWAKCQLRNVSWMPSANSYQHGVDLNSLECLHLLKNNTMITKVLFDILEPSPAYHQSTFMLEALSSESRIMGRVGERTKFRTGNGVYQASVPIDDSSHSGTSSSIALNLYWTSQRRAYSNRVQDIEVAHNVRSNSKKVLGEHNLTNENWKELFGEDRIDYLSRHLEFLGTVSLEFLPEEAKASSKRITLPYCADIPISDWNVGIFKDPLLDTYDSNSDIEVWPFGSTTCRFHRYPAETLAKNSKLRGIRIRLLSDSHGILMWMHGYAKRFCPNTTINDLSGAMYNYDCPDPVYDWMFAKRFYRGVYSDATFQSDFDGLTIDMRKGDTKACHDLLGLGRYNVTILDMSSWLYIYETNEGLENYLVALESLFVQCRQSFPEEFGRHIILLQTSTAVDSSSHDADSIDADFRGIHNYRIEKFCDEATRRLSPYVNGVLPFYNLTYARLKLPLKTSDGVHHPSSTYEELFDVTIDGILSVINSRGGLDLSSSTVVDPRWWVNVSL